MPRQRGLAVNAARLLPLLLLAGAAACARDAGVSAVLELETTGKPSVDKELSERTVSVIKKRFELLGLKGAKFDGSVSGRLRVILPDSGGKAQEALRLMANPSLVEFRRVVEPGSADAKRAATLYEFVKMGDEVVKRPYVVEKTPFLTGKNIQEASVRALTEFDGYAVSIQLDPEGAETFGRVTEKEVGKPLPIAVDGHIISAPVVREAIRGGKLQISGVFTAEEARDLAISLNSGPLPGQVKLVEKHAASGAAVPAAGAAAPAPPAKAGSDVDELPGPDAAPKPGRYAVVIGVQDYRQKLRSADFARRDALSVAEHLVRVLGFPRENVVTLVDDHAAKSDLEKYLEGWLREKAVPGTTAFVYYSGHGAPDPASGDTYIVPYDGDPAFLSKTGYPLKALYRLASELRADRTILALDACFSGAGGRSVAPEGARPLTVRVAPPVPVSGKLVVLSAAGPSQISSTYEEKGHGLFTYFLLKGLRGARHKRLDTAELFDYLKPQVEYTARSLYFNEQSPQMTAPSGPLVLKP